jgi:hypothetical protein
MLPSFYHSILEKYLTPAQLLTATKASLVVTDSKRSQDRTISCNPSIADIAKQF